MRTVPTAVPARLPDGYGQTAATRADLLAWEDVARRIAASPNYWLATAGPGGRPHLRPVDGVFVDDALAFGGSPATRWVRNLLRCPAASASLPDDDSAVILEGDAELVTDPDLEITRAVTRARERKYPRHHRPGEPFRPFWALRPRHVHAWTLTGFPSKATRFDFKASE